MTVQLRPRWQQSGTDYVNPTIDGRVWYDDAFGWCYEYEVVEYGASGSGDNIRSAWRAMVECDEGYKASLKIERDAGAATAETTKLLPGWYRNGSDLVNPSIGGRVWLDETGTWSWVIDTETVGGVGTGYRSAWRAMVRCEEVVAKCGSATTATAELDGAA